MLHLQLDHLEKDSFIIVHSNKSKLATEAVKIQDHILLSRALHKKDRKALGRLHTIYYPRIKRYIASRIDSVEDAEDLAQSVFFELCKGNGCYDGQSNAEAYLSGMARNIISRYHRNRKKQPQTVQIDAVGDIVADCDVQQYRPVSLKQLKKLFRKTTEQLPPKARKAVRLRLGKGLTPKEAAEKCGCSTDAFYKRFDAALKALEVIRETGNLKTDDTANL